MRRQSPEELTRTQQDCVSRSWIEVLFFPTAFSSLRFTLFTIVTMGGLVLVGWAGSQESLQSQSDRREAGEQLYTTHCSTCHQPGGTGILAAFPPLAGHIPDIYGAPGGRSYLIRVLLYGLEGEIWVGDQSYQGWMPSFAHLPDQEVASLLNYILTSWENQERLPSDFKDVDSLDIALARNQELAPQRVHELRSELSGETAEAGQPLQTLPAAEVDGWYSAEQVERGKVTYNRHCVGCHGFSLEGGEFGGVPLSGNYFFKRWRGRSVNELFAYARANMPPGLSGRLSVRTHLDLVAYILQANGYPAGEQPLSSDPKVLARIPISKEGTQ